MSKLKKKDRYIKVTVGLILWIFTLTFAVGIAKIIFGVIGTAHILSAITGYCPICKEKPKKCNKNH